MEAKLAITGFPLGVVRLIQLSSATDDITQLRECSSYKQTAGIGLVLESVKEPFSENSVSLTTASSPSVEDFEDGAVTESQLRAELRSPRNFPAINRQRP